MGAEWCRWMDVKKGAEITAEDQQNYLNLHKQLLELFHDLKRKILRPADRNWEFGGPTRWRLFSVKFIGKNGDSFEGIRLPKHLPADSYACKNWSLGWQHLRTGMLRDPHHELAHHVMELLLTMPRAENLFTVDQLNCIAEDTDMDPEASIWGDDGYEYTSPSQKKRVIYLRNDCANYTDYNRDDWDMDDWLRDEERYLKRCGFYR